MTSERTLSSEFSPILAAPTRSFGACHPLNLRLVPHPFFRRLIWVNVQMQGCTCPGGVRPMAAGLGMMMDERECIVRLLSLILGIGLLLLCARWLPPAVVERVCLRGLPGTGLILRPFVLCRGKFLITAEHSDSDRQT